VTVEVRRIAGTAPIAQELVAAMLAEVATLYAADLGPPPVPGLEELSPPAGGFVVLAEDGRTLAGGGVRRLDDRACEIKRMYVVPAARGRGLGRELLEALEALGRDLGYAVARLDTGAKQPGAQRLYERAGYVAVPDYNGNPWASYWGEKPLSAPD